VSPDYGSPAHGDKLPELRHHQHATKRNVMHNVAAHAWKWLWNPSPRHFVGAGSGYLLWVASAGTIAVPLALIAGDWRTGLFLAVLELGLWREVILNRTARLQKQQMQRRSH
jgi:hypothetical protein